MASSAGVPGITLHWRCHLEGQEMWCGEGSEESSFLDGEFCLSCNMNRLPSSGEEQKRLTKDSATKHRRLLMTPGQVTNLGRPMSHLATGLLGTLMLGTEAPTHWLERIWPGAPPAGNLGSRGVGKRASRSQEPSRLGTKR